MQFGIRKLLLVVVGVAVLCSLYVAARNIYYAERRQAQSALAKIKGISNIDLHSYIDVTEEVNIRSWRWLL